MFSMLRLVDGASNYLWKRKAWDLNPHDSCGVARFSKPARRAVSGYLPFVLVDPPGIEPGFPVCRTGVFPLDHEPVVCYSYSVSR